MNPLPTYHGWTVDVRLGEFRKVPLDDLPRFVSFKSDEGDDLLCDYLDHLAATDPALWQATVSSIHF